jgi:hypothetical protein
LSKKHHRAALSLRRVRSALSNGTTLIAGEDADGRSGWMRRLRDIVHQHVADLGGEANISHSEHVLLNRASMLVLQLEMIEATFAKNNGMASADQLNSYQRLVNTLRRTLETLGLQRRSKDITPLPSVDDYFKHKQKLKQAEAA